LRQALSTGRPVHIPKKRTRKIQSDSTATSKNPYAMAVNYVMSGQNLETNIRKTAKLIADQVAKKAGL
jgi:hypothetical protein